MNATLFRVGEIMLNNPWVSLRSPTAIELHPFGMKPRCFPILEFSTWTSTRCPLTPRSLFSETKDTPPAILTSAPSERISSRFFSPAGAFRTNSRAFNNFTEQEQQLPSLFEAESKRLWRKRRLAWEMKLFRRTGLAGYENCLRLFEAYADSAPVWERTLLS